MTAALLHRLRLALGEHIRDDGTPTDAALLAIGQLIGQMLASMPEREDREAARTTMRRATAQVLIQAWTQRPAGETEVAR